MGKRQKTLIPEPMKFEVAHDPMPNTQGGNFKRYEWPFGTMKVGECFYYPLSNGDGVGQVIAVRSRIFKAANEWKQTGRKFATRVVPEKKAIGIWRIK